MLWLLILCFNVHGQTCNTTLAANLAKGADIELCIFFSVDAARPTKFKIKVDEYARLSIPGSKDLVSDKAIYSWMSIRTKNGGESIPALPDEGCPYTDCADIKEQDICTRVESCTWGQVESDTPEDKCTFKDRTSRSLLSSCPQIYVDKARNKYVPFSNIVLELEQGNLHRIRIDNSCINCGPDERVLSQNALRLVPNSATKREYEENLSARKNLTEDQQTMPSFCMCGKEGAAKDFRYFVAFRGTDKDGNHLGSDVFSYSNFVGATVDSVYKSLIN